MAFIRIKESLRTHWWVGLSSQIYQGSGPLRIGYMDDDGYTQPSPSNARGVREVKGLLEEAGHTVRRQHCASTLRAMKSWVHVFERRPWLLVSLTAVVGALHSSEDAWRRPPADQRCFCRRSCNAAAETVSSSLRRSYVMCQKKQKHFTIKILWLGQSPWRVSLPSSPAHLSVSPTGLTPVQATLSQQRGFCCHLVLVRDHSLFSIVFMAALPSLSLWRL